MATRRGPTLIQRSRRKSAAEKAAFYEVAGAGKSKVKRPFFDLNPKDERAIEDRLSAFLDRQLRA